MRGPYVGHYGCAEEGRLVKVLPPRGTRKPHWSASFKVDCTACGRTHVVRPMWREARPGERAEAERTLLAGEQV